MAKNILFDDYLAEQLKDSEFKAGFDVESAKLESAVALMNASRHADVSGNDGTNRFFSINNFKN